MIWKVQLGSSTSMERMPGSLRAAWMFAPCAPIARPTKSSGSVSCSKVLPCCDCHLAIWEEGSINSQMKKIWMPTVRSDKVREKNSKPHFKDTVRSWKVVSVSRSCTHYLQHQRSKVIKGIQMAKANMQQSVNWLKYNLDKYWWYWAWY